MAHLYNSELDRYCGAINLAGTNSLRSSSSKVFGLFGGNAQNTPPEFRACLVPPEGYNFVEVDQASAESRIVAYECDPGNFQDVFKYNLNAHAFLTTHMPYAAVVGCPKKSSHYLPQQCAADQDWLAWAKTLKKKHPRYYALSKSSGHGYNYKMAWKTFQRSVLAETKGAVVLDAPTSKSCLLSVGAIYPEITRFHIRIELQVRETGRLENVFGHPRLFVQRLNDEAIRQAINFIPQSTVGMLTHIAAVRLLDFDRPKWRLKATIHDSLLVACPKEETEDCIKTLGDCFRIPLTSTTGIRYIMEVESHVFETYWEK